MKTTHMRRITHTRPGAFEAIVFALALGTLVAIAGFSAAKDIVPDKEENATQENARTTSPRQFGTPTMPGPKAVVGDNDTENRLTERAGRGPKTPATPTVSRPDRGRPTLDKSPLPIPGKGSTPSKGGSRDDDSKRDPRGKGKGSSDHQTNRIWIDGPRPGQRPAPPFVSPRVAHPKYGYRDTTRRVIPVPRRYPTRRLEVDIWTDYDSYSGGEAIRVFFRTTQDAYVYIFDTDTRGVTRQLFPNYYDPEHFVRGGVTYAIPDRGYSLTVDGPSGHETLEVVAVSQQMRGLTPYTRFSASIPFPTRRGGTKELLRSIESHSSLNLGISGRHGRASIAIGASPAYRSTTVARATTSFWVSGHQRGWTTDERIGRLRISSSPSNARIYVNGEYVGKTTETVELYYGHYEVAVEKDGYYSETRTVRVDSRDRERVKFHLERIRR